MRSARRRRRRPAPLVLIHCSYRFLFAFPTFRLLLLIIYYLPCHVYHAMP